MRIERTKASLENEKKFWEIVGTALEALGGGVTAGYLAKFLKALTENSDLNFILRHIGPAAAGGLLFALIGTLIRFEKKYLETSLEVESRPTRGEYFKSGQHDSTRFGVNLWTVGGLSFAAFTASLELSKNLPNPASQVISVTIGGAGIMHGNKVANLGFDSLKILQIWIVLGGFALGGYAAEKLTVEGNLSINVLENVIQPTLGAIVAAGSSFVWNLLMEAAKSVYTNRNSLFACCSCKKKLPPRGEATQTEDEETNPLLVEQENNPQWVVINK